MTLRKQARRLRERAAQLARDNRRLQSLLLESRGVVLALQHENSSLVQENTALALEIERLRIVTFTDPLTGVYNRTGMRHIWDEIKSDVTGVMIIDSDWFKQVNDRYGHGTGDVVICHIAATIRSCGIVACRTGGDEFIGLITDQSPAKVAEGFRQAVSVPRIVNGHSITTTVTIGLCLIDHTEDGAPKGPLISYLDRADAALYQGKEAGRNTIVITQL